MQTSRLWVERVATSLGVLGSGCGPGATSPAPLPTAPPTMVTAVATSGFTSPTDAVASPDGRTFYFGGVTDPGGDPAVFSIAAAGGAVSRIVVGDPLSYPTGLVLSCDGGTLYVADSASAGGAGTGDEGAVFSLGTASGTLADLGVTGVSSPQGLAMGPDCQTLYISGQDASGAGAIFRVSADGGPATAIATGSPLVSPTGLHVDSQNVVWALDHLALGMNGIGVLYSIAPGGAPAEVVSGLRLGAPGGVSLTAGGGTAVIPTRDAAGQGQLTAITIATGAVTNLPAPQMLDPAGLRTARSAGVFAV